MQIFYSSGKLMISGEYAVLQGATALALPTIKGQSLTVEEKSDLLESCIFWDSYDENGEIWFNVKINLPNFLIEETTDELVAIQLVRFLITAKALNPIFLNESKIYSVKTILEFDRELGLGSSSTLTNNIAQWANVDAFKLHFNAFKGSGFDLAVANFQEPLLYQVNHQVPTIEIVHWDKSFNNLLFFVYLNKKQISRNEIASFQNKPQFSFNRLEEITRVSKLLAHSNDYFEFCLLLEIAESETSEALGRPTIKQEMFSDFHGTIKSLGAWGGDFILATGENTEEYFTTKGFNQIVPFNEMIKTK
ncbi:MAG: GHMP kinase [Bacteroidetes bacterium]|nr:GHMP kinase [Bacteroidota bacterium]